MFLSPSLEVHIIMLPGMHNRKGTQCENILWEDPKDTLVNLHGVPLTIIF